MLKSLRPYQEADALFLSRLNAGGCFNEQRTGKTPTILRVAEICNVQKMVAITPASAMYQWADEIIRWLGGCPFVCAGDYNFRRETIDIWKNFRGTIPCLIISYDSLKETMRTKGLVEYILKAAPEMIIVDEAHRIRHRNSAQAKAVYRLSKIPRRYALTGTPAPGKSHDIWGILHFLCPNTFNSFWNFINDFYRTVRMRNQQGDTYIDILEMLPDKKRTMQYILNKISIQRKRKDVMPWLPEKELPIPIRLPLTKEQTKYLKELKDMWETEHIVTIGVLDRLIRYRQICLAPELIGLKGSSPKLDWIDDYLSDYPERPTVIFSKFTSFLQLIKKRHPEVGVLVGNTPLVERERLRKNFQNGKLKVLLIQIDIGKEALTLDIAEALIFTDKYPPIGDIEQAEDRFVATTEDKAKIPKTIYELMMKGAYDEKLYELLREHKSETAIINDYKNYMERSE